MEKSEEMQDLRTENLMLKAENQMLHQLNVVLHDCLTDMHQAYSKLQTTLLTVTNDGSK